MTRNTIFMRLRTALCNSACLFFGLPVFLCGMSMFRIQEISSMRSMSICRLSLATLSLASCAVTEAQTPSPIVVNSVVTPVHQPAAAVTTFSIPVSAGSFMDVSIIASYGDVVSGVNACLPSGACTALTQACPPSGSCFGATASTGEALQFYSLNVPSGITSIQVKNSSPVGGMAIAVLEASNVASFLTAAQVSNQTTGTTNPVGPSVTSSGAGIVISGLSSTGTAVTAAAAPFQFVQTSYGDGLAYVVNGASGTFSPSWTTQTAGRWAGFTAAFLGATGGGPGPISVSVAPSTASVAVNATQPFTATVQNDSQNKGVTWALSGTGCSGAACGTLSANSSASGVAITYTAPGSVPNPATVTLTATSVTDGTKSAAATITVTAPSPIVVNGVVTPVHQPAAAVTTFSIPASAGSFMDVSIIATYGDVVSGVNACLPSGTCTALTQACPPSGSCFGATVSTGEALQFYSLNVPSGITSVQVTNSQPVGGMAIAVLEASNVASFLTAAQVSNQTTGTTNPVGPSVTSSGSGIVISDLSSTGTAVTAAAAPFQFVQPSYGDGLAYVVNGASGTFSPSWTTQTAGRWAGFTAAFLGATGGGPGPISVSVAPSTASVAGNATQPFTATVQNDSQNKGVTWALSGTGCSGAACGTLSANSSASGVAITYTAPSSVPNPATVTLTATSVSDGTKSSAATITVTSGGSGNISVSVTPKRGGLTISQSLAFTAVVANDVGGAGVTWSASAGSFSSQSTTFATYVAPIPPRVVTITVTSVADVTKSASATIGVTDLPGVTTYHNNLSRDGTNAQEYAFTTSNVATASFAKLFSCTVDAAIYAQPLWVANLAIAGGTHNVVFAATSRDTVYAFDADASPCTTYWNKSLLPSGETPVSYNDVGNTDIQPEIGIVGTPVIDLSSETMYVVSKSKNNATNCTPSSSCHQRLHALSLIDGSEKFGGPADITSSITVPGTGDGSSGGILSFDTRRQNQRPGLALVNGVVYVAWASHGDQNPYHGWVIGFDKTTLSRLTVYNDSPNGFRAGIWMAGGAPAADSNNNLYVITGNGTFDGNSSSAPNNDFGDSILKLGTASGLSLSSWFTPSNESTLDSGDLDLGSGGATVLVDAPSSPKPRLLIGGGKEGKLYLLDRDALGNFGDLNAWQIFSIGNGIFATPAFWENKIYIAGDG